MEPSPGGMKGQLHWGEAGQAEGEDGRQWPQESASGLFFPGGRGREVQARAGNLGDLLTQDQSPK